MAEETTTPPAPPVPTGEPKQGFVKVMEEVAKFTFFGVFCLYAIGFIIWHAHLANYGISSLPFLQSEYLATAVCYIFLSILFAVPVFLIAKQISFKPTQQRHLERIEWISCAWVTLIATVIPLMFHSEYFYETQTGDTIVRRYALRILLGVALYITLGMAVKKVPWMHRMNVKPVPIVFFCIWIITLVMSFNTELSIFYVLTHLFPYAVIKCLLTKKHSKGIDKWKHATPEERCLVAILMFTFSCSHIVTFSNLQFGKIPRGLGGGKPETAYIKLADDAYANMLQLPFANRWPNSNIFVGPIDILFRSDKEIIFINHSAKGLTEYFTNRTGWLVTTNSSTNHVLLGETNQVSTIRETIINEVVTTTTNAIVTATYEVTAKQLPADAVKAIIFTK